MTDRAEPVVGNPEQMAQAIAGALNLISEWRVSDRATPLRNWEDLYELKEMASDTLGQIEDALENYTEL